MIREIQKGSSFSDYWFIKNQIGTDGLHETVDGKVREKWNDYQMSLFEHWKSNSPLGFYPTSCNSAFTPIGGWATTGGSRFDNLEIAAINKLYNSVRGHELDLGKSLAESHQTINMITDNLKRIAQCAWYLKQGHVGRAAESLGIGAIHSAKDYKKIQRAMKFKDASDRFLEVQFGWKPLLSDIQQAVGILTRDTSKPRVWTHKVSQGAPEQTFKADLFFPVEYRAIGTIRDKVYITYEMTEVLSTSRSLDLDNIAGIAWEVTPFSFIGDWIIPIGPYLDALNNAPKLKGRFCVTRRRKMRNWCSETIHQNYVGSSFVARGTVMDRKVSTTLTPPLPSFKPVESIFTGLHIAESIALFHQRMAKAFDGSRKPYR